MRPLYIIGMLASALALSLALGLASCTSPEILAPDPQPTPPDDPTMTTVRFDFGVDNPVMSTDQSTAATRTVDENAITDLQLLLVGENGQRYYFEPGAQKFLVTTIKRGMYTVYTCSGTQIRLNKILPPLLNRTMVEYSDSDATLTMSHKATVDFTEGASSRYTVKLVRTVAKLRFNIAAAPNITITGMSLRSAPGQTRLFPATFSGASFGTREITPPSDGSFTLYLPENLAGANTSITNQRERTAANAPANATYLKIEGEATAPTGANWTVDRRKFEIAVYLGSNTAGDFNIKRNYDYRINITIAADLSTDTRIEHSEVGYTAVERLTPDEKFVWCGAGAVPFVRINPYYRGSGQAAFKCVITGFSREFTIGTSFKVERPTLTSPATITGTIAGGQSVSINLGYGAWNFEPSNSRVSCVMTFTTPDGTVTEYRREWRFANRTHIFVEPQYGQRYDERTAVLTTPDGCIEWSSNNLQAEVFHGEKSLKVTVEPLPGYVFKGWYSVEPPYKTQNRITTEPTVTIHVGRTDGVVAYARVEKEG